jgi:MOSC domain-containing protein YiiM
MRGVKKNEVGGQTRLVEGYGVESDAHGGNWHRQVSLLSYDKVREFNERGGEAENGDFGENLVVEGIDLSTLPVGTRLRVNDALLEVTQIGKECHRHCQIYERVGDCIMPREGIFARVLAGGSVEKGDVVEIV